MVSNRLERECIMRKHVILVLLMCCFMSGCTEGNQTDWSSEYYDWAKKENLITENRKEYDPKRSITYLNGAGMLVEFFDLDAPSQDTEEVMDVNSISTEMSAEETRILQVARDNNIVLDSISEVEADYVLNRAEAIAMAVNAIGTYLENDHEKLYDDVDPQEWYAKHIYTAWELGILDSFNSPDDFHFHPDAPIMLEEFIRILFEVDKFRNVISNSDSNMQKNDYTGSHCTIKMKDGALNEVQYYNSRGEMIGKLDLSKGIASGIDLYGKPLEETIYPKGSYATSISIWESTPNGHERFEYYNTGLAVEDYPFERKTYDLNGMLLDIYEYSSESKSEPITHIHWDVETGERYVLKG